MFSPLNFEVVKFPRFYYSFQPLMFLLGFFIVKNCKLQKQTVLFLPFVAFLYFFICNHTVPPDYVNTYANKEREEGKNRGFKENEGHTKY